jgi:predicted anti-sigma-YlaC factor YlaD
MMKCREVYLHICDRLDENIDSPKCRAIKRHLSTCADCAAYLDSVKKTVTLYRTMPIPRVPVSAHRELFKSIDAVWERPRRQRAGRRHSTRRK